jgi:hypothetical protein
MQPYCGISKTALTLAFRLLVSLRASGFGKSLISAGFI